MAHMWTKSAAGWEARKLDPKLYDLDSLSIAQAGESIAGAAGAPGTRRLLAAVGGTRTWVLAASPTRRSGSTAAPCWQDCRCSATAMRSASGRASSTSSRRRTLQASKSFRPRNGRPTAAAAVSRSKRARRRCAVRSVTSGTTSRPNSRAGPIPTNAPIAVIPHLLRPVFRGFPRSK